MQKRYQWEELEKEGDSFNVEIGESKKRSMWAYIGRIAREKGYRVTTRTVEGVMTVTRAADIG
jgi:hypothetical protein